MSEGISGVNQPDQPNINPLEQNEGKESSVEESVLGKEHNKLEQQPDLFKEPARLLDDMKESGDLLKLGGKVALLGVASGSVGAGALIGGAIGGPAGLLMGGMIGCAAGWMFFQLEESIQYSPELQGYIQTRGEELYQKELGKGIEQKEEIEEGVKDEPLVEQPEELDEATVTKEIKNEEDILKDLEEMEKKEEMEIKTDDDLRKKDANDNWEDIPLD